MSFQIQQEPFGSTTAYRLINTKNTENCVIVPTWGGVLKELNLAANGQLYSLIDCPESYEELFADTHYLSAILFPFPSRIPNGKFTFEGTTYQLPINEPARNTAIHGFVHPNPYIVLEENASENSASLKLGYHYDGSLSGYPFPFQLSITYTLRTNELTLQYDVKNVGSKNLPMAFGWHPYYKLGGGKTDEFEIEIPSSTIVTFDKQMIPTGTAPFAQSGRHSLEAQVLDNCFVLDSTKAETNVFYKKKDLQLTIFQDIEQLKYLVVYTPSHRNTIAIEPLSSNVNALNSGEGLIVLKPNESTSGKMGVRLSTTAKHD